MKLINKKNIYILALLIICLIGIIIVPTYAKFASEFITEEDAVALSLNFNLGISNIEEYEELTVPAGGTEKFNVEITNSTGSTVYYGIWYKMVTPTTLSTDMQIGKLKGSTVSTSASIDTNGSTTATIGIVNSSNTDMKVHIGVASSSTSTSDIEYVNNRYLITGEVSLPKDITISSITIDGESSDSLPTSGTYTMTSSCSLGSSLSWNTYNKNITYAKGAKIGDKCSLTFTTSTNYPKLHTMPVGSYVAYTGSGGTVGSTQVQCQTNGTASSSGESAETEAPNSCLGQNARQDLDSSNYTYGYCYDSIYKYYTTGWRIAYIDTTTNASNPKAVIISAGSPECNTRDNTENGNGVYIRTANAKALKYCNTEYVDGNCTCADSDGDGLCDEKSTDAWAVNDTDFYYMTKAISGYGKRLTSYSSSLGDSGGTLGTTLYCYKEYSYQECGYNNDLIDNGGYYWFASKYSGSNANGVSWSPNARGVTTTSNAGAYGLRPVISLSSSVYVTGGSGTMSDPYQISN